MKPIDIVFHAMVGILIGINVYDFFTPDVLIGVQVLNAMSIAMLGIMINRLSYKLAHVPVQEKYIKPSRRRRRV